MDDRLFDVGGKLSADAFANLKAGIDVPLVGFVGIDKTWTFASATLFEFSTDHIGLPTGLVPPQPTLVQLYSYDAGNRILTLNLGTRANLRGIAPLEINESFTFKHLGRALLVTEGGFGFNTESLLRPVAIDKFEISAFGITQLFSGRVDNVDANMGTGNDTLKSKINPAYLLLHRCRRWQRCR